MSVVLHADWSCYSNDFDGADLHSKLIRFCDANALSKLFINVTVPINIHDNLATPFVMDGVWFCVAFVAVKHRFSKERLLVCAV